MRRDPLPEVLDAPPGEMHAMLRELLAEVRALRCDLARQRDAVIDPTLVALVHTLARRVGVEVAFSASELIEQADDTVREALGDMNAHALGRQLARLEGRDIDGLCVTRVGRDAGGVIWSIRAGVLSPARLSAQVE